MELEHEVICKESNESAHQATSPSAAVIEKADDNVITCPSHLQSHTSDIVSDEVPQTGSSVSSKVETFQNVPSNDPEISLREWQSCERNQEQTKKCLNLGGDKIQGASALDHPKRHDEVFTPKISADTSAQRRSSSGAGDGVIISSALNGRDTVANARHRMSVDVRAREVAPRRSLFFERRKRSSPVVEYSGGTSRDCSVAHNQDVGASAMAASALGGFSTAGYSSPDGPRTDKAEFSDEVPGSANKTSFSEAFSIDGERQTASARPQTFSSHLRNEDRSKDGARMGWRDFLPISRKRLRALAQPAEESTVTVEPNEAGCQPTVDLIRTEECRSSTCISTESLHNPRVPTFSHSKNDSKTAIGTLITGLFSSVLPSSSLRILSPGNPSSKRQRSGKEVEMSPRCNAKAKGSHHFSDDGIDCLREEEEHTSHTPGIADVRIESGPPNLRQNYLDKISIISPASSISAVTPVAFMSPANALLSPRPRSNTGKRPRSGTNSSSTATASGGGAMTGAAADGGKLADRVISQSDKTSLPGLLDSRIARGRVLNRHSNAGNAAFRGRTQSRLPASSRGDEAVAIANTEPAKLAPIGLSPITGDAISSNSPVIRQSYEIRDDEHALEDTSLVSNSMAKTMSGRYRSCFRNLHNHTKNSFFARRLLVTTAAVVLLNTASILCMYLASTKFRFQKLENGCQATANLWVLFNYVITVNALYGLSAFGPPHFSLFSVDWNARKLVRTKFLNACELFIVMEVVFLSAWTLIAILGPFVSYGITACLYTDSYLEISVQAVNVLIYGLSWNQINLFNLYRHHLELQYCTFGFKTVNHPVRQRQDKHENLLNLCLLASHKRKRARRFRRSLHEAVTTEDVSAVERLLYTARQELGNDFVQSLYGDGIILWGLLGMSNLNPLHAAAANGNVRIADLLLNAGFHVNMFDRAEHSGFNLRNAYSWCTDNFFLNPWSRTKGIKYHGVGQMTMGNALATPLHVAAANAQVEMVKWLIENGAQVNLPAKSLTADGCVPPLYWVENTQVMKVLLANGANHLYVPRKGSYMTLTVLQHAYLREYRTLYRILEEWGGDVALTQLHTAAASNSAPAVEQLLRSGMDPNTLGDQFPAASLRTPLHWSSIVGSIDAAKVLLQFGANLNAPDMFGRTPLHWAARNNHLPVVRLLLESGANASAADKQDKTPILLAAESSFVSQDIFAALTYYGADIHHMLPNGDTALHIALKLENRATAVALLRNGADIMITNCEGKRPVDCTTSTDLQFAVKKEAGARDVMISYTHSHTEFATKIRSALEANNITTWMDTMDPTGIGGGAVWREEIARGIQSASLVLCILSDDYTKSPWCRKELAFAKQMGTPILAISCEETLLDDELQVYLFRRQMIPFLGCITDTDASNPKNVRFYYDERKFEFQLGLLLDGIRDEIERQRAGEGGGIDEYETASELESERSHERVEGRGQADGTPQRASCGEAFDFTINTRRASKTNGGEESWVASRHESSESKPASVTTSVFVSHGDCHPDFAKQLEKEFRKNNMQCIVDRGEGFADMKERIIATKDHILASHMVLVILSRESSRTELVSDQLAFAEDKGKKIIPIIVSNPRLDLGKLYSLSRSTLFHFAEGIGFDDSFRTLMNHLKLSEMSGESHERRVATNAVNSPAIKDSSASQANSLTHMKNASFSPRTALSSHSHRRLSTDSALRFEALSPLSLRSVHSPSEFVGDYLQAGSKTRADILLKSRSLRAIVWPVAGSRQQPSRAEPSNSQRMMPSGLNGGKVTADGETPSRNRRHSSSPYLGRFPSGIDVSERKADTITESKAELAVKMHINDIQPEENIDRSAGLNGIQKTATIFCSQMSSAGTKVSTSQEDKGPALYAGKSNDLSFCMNEGLHLEKLGSWKEASRPSLAVSTISERSFEEECTTPGENEEHVEIRAPSNSSTKRAALRQTRSGLTNGPRMNSKVLLTNNQLEDQQLELPHTICGATSPRASPIATQIEKLRRRMPWSANNSKGTRQNVEIASVNPEKTEGASISS